MTKIAIDYPLRSGPWGGANQFLAALKGELMRLGSYSPRLKDADAILVNSHHWTKGLQALLKARKNTHSPPIIHRIDGPIKFARGPDGLDVDRKIFDFNRKFASASVFQSQWSRARSKDLGFIPVNPTQVISNAPDPQYFFPRSFGRAEGRTRVVASSWSSNVKKGHSFFRDIDRLAAQKVVEFTFVGRTPVQLPNSIHIEPVQPKFLGALLRTQDVFVAPSSDDPCSNALIEAAHCGLRVIALRSGGHPELVDTEGRLFGDLQEMVALLTSLKTETLEAPQITSLPSIGQIAQDYLSLATEINGSNSDHSG